MKYRIMPHNVTQTNIRSRLDSFLPDKEQDHVVNFEKECVEFQRGDRVQCRIYVGKNKWTFGKISKRTGRLHYEITLDNGKICRRHINQMMKCHRNVPVQSDVELDHFDYVNPESDSNEPIQPRQENLQEPEHVTQNVRPRRNVRFPQYLQDYDLN
ncbi:hypothetical protein PPYR_01054 [Photinus pyralis]|uniref:Uncharacterized protein n=1 Tax=Photinus pyralis TaxID=7054 RepID=A0A5N4B3E7_PHOPY|nr:hypothetical protein PPYR_01054 [Photinus pyralis]